MKLAGTTLLSELPSQDSIASSLPSQLTFAYDLNPGSIAVTCINSQALGRLAIPKCIVQQHEYPCKTGTSFSIPDVSPEP